MFDPIFDKEFKQRRIEESEKIKAVRAEQRKFQRQVSVAMSEVKGDPRWKVYADHIQMMFERHSAMAQAAKDTLGDPLTFLSPEETGKLKLRAAYNQGKAEGYSDTLKVIKDLIDRGKEPEAVPEKLVATFQSAS